MIIPSDDGITHINVYSKGKTELGRFLSNFYPIHVETEDGCFESIEGYWYWLGTDHPDRDKLRLMSGYEAKSVGKNFRVTDRLYMDNEEFKRKIRDAMTWKMNNNPEMFRMLQQSILPLQHYYVFYGKVIAPKDNLWVLEHLRDLAYGEV